MKTATQRLHDLIRLDIERRPHAYAEEYGKEWYNLRRCEAAIFGLELHDLPSVIAVWTAYEHMIGIAGEWDIPEDIVQGFLQEHPWLAKRRAGRTIAHDDFMKFARLFGIPHRKSHAWYWKHEFYHVRAGIVTFADEARWDEAPAHHDGRPPSQARSTADLKSVESHERLFNDEFDDDDIPF